MSSDPLVLVGNDKGGTISALRVVDDQLELLANTHVGAGCSTFAVDALRGLVYSATKEPSPAVVTLRLDRESGELSESSRHGVDDPLAYVALAGDALLGASYHGGWGGSWPLLGGVLGAMTARVEHRNLHAAVPGPRDDTAYFVSLGDDLIAQFAIEDEGQLAPLDPATVACPPGSGPRHLVISGDGRNAYLLTEFTGEAIRFGRDADGRLTGAESVRAYDVDAGLGTSAYGLDPRAGHLVWGAELALAAGGRWLLCSERTESTIAAIELDHDGHLTQRVVLSGTEEQPRGMTVSPEGNHVIVAGERSGCVSLYRLDDGELVPLHRVETGLGPNWVRYA